MPRAPTFPGHEELNCDICEFCGASSVGLKIHKGRKHDSVPHVDGESLTTRNTDCWWEKNRQDRLKNYQIFMDVLMDIDEAALSEAEKSAEREHVTNKRKEPLGSNYIYCAPWNSGFD